MSCWAAGRRSSAENAGSGGASKTVAARAGKRLALGDLTNVFRGRGWSSGSAPEAVRLLLARCKRSGRRVTPIGSFRERVELGRLDSRSLE